MTSSRSQPGCVPAVTTSGPVPSAACSHCPLELGCGSLEVCRIMSMSDEEIIGTTPDAERVAEEMRAILLAALAKAENPP